MKPIIYYLIIFNALGMLFMLVDKLKAKENAPSGVACSGRLTRWAYKIESGLYALKKEGLKVFLKKAAKRFGL